MNNWIFLSKNGKDEYVNKFAMGCDGRVINTDDFIFEDTTDPIVLRGILKHKIMKRCWFEGRDFYFMDTGYMGNHRSAINPLGWKYYHRIVKNDLQHNNIIKRSDDRFSRLGIKPKPFRKNGRKILIAKPDEKPMKFYDQDLDSWLEDTINTIKKYTDRPIIVRERVKSRSDRIIMNSLQEALDDDIHCLITFNSNAATESILLGVPAFTLAPTHAAKPVTSQDLSQIETPYYPEMDKVYQWACHLAYGQFHVRELEDGTAWRILNES
jgi:hypothetical protein